MNEQGPGSTLKCETCGYETTPGQSSKNTEAAFAKHACGRQLWMRARRARRLEREAAVDRTPKPCHHSAQHQHGTIYAYEQDKCRCDSCVGAGRRGRRDRERLIQYGKAKSGYVDAMATKAHLLVLLRRISGPAVAKEAGLSIDTLIRVRTARRGTRIQVATAEAIQRVPVRVGPGAPPKAVVPALGTSRRIRGAVAEGWTFEELGRRLGYTNATFVRTLASTAGVVQQKTAVRFAAVIDALPAPVDGPPAQRARDLARSRGWVPTVAWDDIDDPRERPKGVAA